MIYQLYFFLLLVNKPLKCDDFLRHKNKICHKVLPSLKLFCQKSMFHPNYSRQTCPGLQGTWLQVGSGKYMAWNTLWFSIKSFEERIRHTSFKKIQLKNLANKLFSPYKSWFILNVVTQIWSDNIFLNGIKHYYLINKQKNVEDFAKWLQPLTLV